MGIDNPLYDSLLGALNARPDDVPLRLHLAQLLLDNGDTPGAIAHIAQALVYEPSSAAAARLMSLALQAGPETGPAVTEDDAAAATDTPVRPRAAPAEPAPPQDGFDWQAAERQVEDIVAKRFVDDDGADQPIQNAYSAERPKVRLSDVGGMDAVKQRLDVAFLAPMRNPELRRLYGKSLRGGLLLYGPPGCGKTFLARAIAGEMDAQFLAVGIADVLDMYIGRSERNLHEIFSIARRKAPCVLFFDEVDALGQRRSQTRNTAMRATVNQLLLEMDDVQASNEGVFLLGATNQPWDVDAALRRPGRFDRTVLVLPPDPPARQAIITYHLRERPVAGIDVGWLVRRTEGFSGADLAHLCETAAERALIASASSGAVRMIGMPDFVAALAEIRPSVTSWFESARSVALFANEGGAYDELVTYLRQRRML
jgi:ATP-dependent 26S proteasome regulatory subunit